MSISTVLLDWKLLDFDKSSAIEFIIAWVRSATWRLLHRKFLYHKPSSSSQHDLQH